MDNLEAEFQAANSRLLVRRQGIVRDPNTQIFQSRSFTTIADIQAALEQRAQETRQGGFRGQMDRLAVQDWRDRETWQALREAKRNNFEAYLKACGVPKIFMEVPVTHESRSLFLTGGYGIGKTHKAISILKDFVMNLPCAKFVEPFKDTPIFATAPELLSKIRACFTANESEANLLSIYMRSPLLILDDLGVEKTTEWALQALYVVVNRRYLDGRQTIITSNLTLDEVREKLGDRIASRIVGMCHPVRLTGRDRRLQKKN